MALTQITSAGISDDAVTTDKLANAINTARDANTAKTTNATHSGEVTGATALTIADNVVDEANLKVSNSPTNGYFLSAQSGNTGGLTWAQVSTDLVADTSPQLGGDLDSNGNNIKITDGEELRFGDGNDLVIKHDGSHSYINDNGTGNLYLSVGGAFYIQNQAQDEALAIFNENGSCDLYYDNSKTAWTTGTGFNIKGGNTAAQTELQIYGNEGRDAEILLAADDGDDNADYWKIISSSDNSFYLQNYTGGSYATNIKATGNAGVEVYFNNSKKFETTSDGVLMNGHTDYQDNQKARFGASDDLQIYHDGTNSYIDETNGSNNLWIRGQANIYMGFGSEKMATFSPNGAVELYNDNSKKLATTSEGCAVYDADNDSRITFYTNGSSNRGSVYASSGVDIGFLNSGGSWSFRADNNKSVHFYNHAYPTSNNSYDLGSTSYRWRNIYSNDLHLSNEGSSNDVDGTWGSYTIQEGAEDLFLINKRTGKKYKFNLTEVS